MFNFSTLIKPYYGGAIEYVLHKNNQSRADGVPGCCVFVVVVVHANRADESFRIVLPSQ